MPVHEFTRVCSKNFPISDSTGFFGTNLDVEFSFSLSQVVAYLSGTLFANINVPSSFEFSSLFQEYKIKEVEVTIYFSNNNSSVNTPSNSLPLINVVFDPLNVAATSLTSVQQYENNKVFLLGDGASSPPKFVIKPVPSRLVYESATTNGGSPTSGWISTSQADVPHYGLKIVYDPLTVPGVPVNIGAIGFYFRSTYQLRGVD